MRWMILSFALSMTLAPCAMAQYTPIGGSGDAQTHVTWNVPPTWSMGIRNVWEVPNGTPVNYFGFSVTVTSSTNSLCSLAGGFSPVPATAVQSEWDSQGQYLQTPFSRTPTTGILEDDTHYIVTFGAAPQGGHSVQLWFKAYIIVGKPKGSAFTVDTWFAGAMRADNDTVAVPVHTSVAACSPSFTASHASKKVVMRTVVTPLSATGIQPVEFAGGPAWFLNLPFLATPAGSFNATGQHVFRVTVLDETFDGSFVTEFTVDVTPPLQITTALPLPDGTDGTPYQLAFAAAGGVPPYTWHASGLPTGWQLDVGGNLAAPAHMVVTGQFNFLVTVHDALTMQALPCAIAVVPPGTPLFITTQPHLPVGTELLDYSIAIAAAGGTPPYTWQGAGLPPGWSISVSGVLSAPGHAVHVGTFGFHVMVADAGTGSAMLACTLVVDPLPPLHIQTHNLPNAVLGQHYSAGLAATGGSGSGYSWSIAAGSLPQGLQLSWAGGSSAAQVTGVATQTGMYVFDVVVADSLGHHDVRQFCISVAAPAMERGMGTTTGSCTAASESVTTWCLLALLAVLGLRRRVRA